MTSNAISDEILSTLKKLGDALIPANDPFPVFSDIKDIDRNLTKAVAACGTSPGAFNEAVGQLPAAPDFAMAKSMSETDADAFELIGTVISGAYYMAPEILKLLNYPRDRQHPAAMEEFLEEYETGIVDPVTDRGPQYVVPEN